MVVLVLHVVAVGGILAFEMFKPENTTADKLAAAGDKPIVADEPSEPSEPSGTSEPSEAPGEVEEEIPTEMPPAVVREQRLGGYERYIVQGGDDIGSIADHYQISRAELLTANRIDEQHPLVPGRILRIPKVLLPGGSSANLQPVNSEDTLSRRTPSTTPRLPESGSSSDAPSPALPVPPPLLDEAIAILEGGEESFSPLGVAPSAPVTSSRTPDPTPGGGAEEISTSTTSDRSDEQADDTRDDENARPEIVAPRVEQETAKPTEPRVRRQLPAGSGDSPAPAASSGKSHTVAAGETLYRISRRYGVTVDQILKANPGTRPEALAIGKKLRIP